MFASSAFALPNSSGRDAAAHALSGSPRLRCHHCRRAMESCYYEPGGHGRLQSVALQTDLQGPADGRGLVHWVDWRNGCLVLQAPRPADAPMGRCVTFRPQASASCLSRKGSPDTTSEHACSSRSLPASCAFVLALCRYFPQPNCVDTHV